MCRTSPSSDSFDGGTDLSASCSGVSPPLEVTNDVSEYRKALTIQFAQQRPVFVHQRIDVLPNGRPDHHHAARTKDALHFGCAAITSRKVMDHPREQRKIELATAQRQRGSRHR